jgi:hypothetical protein
MYNEISIYSFCGAKVLIIPTSKLVDDMQSKYLHLCCKYKILISNGY